MPDQCRKSMEKFSPISRDDHRSSFAGRPGNPIPPYYDSMLAKLIVHGENRQEAIAKMKSALGEVIIQGVDTNVDYQFEIMNDPDYQKGQFDIGFLASHQIGGVKVNEA